MDPVGRSPGGSGVPPRAPSHQILSPNYSRLAPGATITASAGVYRVLKQMSDQGAMSVVYLVRNLQDQQTQVLKAVMEAARLDDPTQHPMILDRFADEIRILSLINNPHVVKIFDRDTDKQPQFYVMEYAYGGSLTSFLEKARAEGRDQSISPLSKARVVIQLLDGLNAFHESALRLAPAGTKINIAHRDIKPDNVYIQLENGVPKSVKIADFGIVKLPGSTKTKTGVIMGTPTYMSPEAFLGARHADQRSDNWAVGAMLYWFMTGVEPFAYLGDLANWNDFVARPGEHVKALMKRLDPNVPAALWKIIFTALAPKPEHRYQTYLEFQNALTDFVNS